MSKELSRRDFLKASALAGVSLVIPHKESEPFVPPLDILPEESVEYSSLPFGRELEKIIGDGVYPPLGYRHLQQTVNVDNTPDGGHHIGVDFNWGDFDEDMGTPLKLAFNGVCVYTGNGEWRNLGKVAIFCHRLPDGSLIYSRYGHLDSWFVEPGKNYQAGDFIGKMGKSGWKYGFSHLHLDIANRDCFEKHYLDDPWWYPHKAPIREIERYFLDPVELLEQFPREEIRRWRLWE